MKQIVLSVFSGGGLLDRAFEEAGFFVVSLGDILLGQDIRRKHVPKGFFDGVIGGPPCQVFSRGRGAQGTTSVNLIPEYLRIVHEAEPRWAIMENVEQAAPAAPDWPSVPIRDWDCVVRLSPDELVEGHTSRVRRFWFKGCPPPPEPPVRPGRPAWSVLATSWKYRPKSDSVHSALDPNAAAYLQGWQMMANELISAFPDAISDTSKGRFATHLMGNGVPRAMGLYLAKWVAEMT